MQFSFPIRVYYEDTDAGGIVYYANYLKFYERCRTEWLRALGIEQDQLLLDGIGFVVTNIEVSNLSPARFNDLLSVQCDVKQLKKASILFTQQIIDEQGKLINKATVKVACVNLRQMKPIGIPAHIIEVLK